MTMESGMTPIRLLVVDDHNLFRRGLIALLAQDSRFSVVGGAADAGEGPRSASRLQPDVILLDNHLPGVSGIDAIGSLKAGAPQARVVKLAVSEDKGALADGLDDTHELQQRIRRAVGKWINSTHRRRPMIIPVVVEA